VFAGGWPHFAIDSVRYNSASFPNTNAVVYIRQSLFGAPNIYNNVPLEISFFNSNKVRYVSRVMVNGALSSATVTVPFSPAYCALNYDAKISDATSTEAKRLKTLGVNNFTLGKVICTIQNTGNDTSLIRAIHHYVKPDDFKTNHFHHHLSDQHYWTIEGMLSQGFYAKAKFYFDGFKNLSTTNGYMDTLLTRYNTDSIVLFYRKNTNDDWRMVQYFTKGITSTKSGFIEADTLKLGEYAFGNLADTLTTAVIGIKDNKSNVKVFPNPSKHFVNVELAQKPETETFVELTDMSGKLLLKQELVNQKNNIDLSHLARGTYIVSIVQEKQLLYSEKLLLE